MKTTMKYLIVLTLGLFCFLSAQAIDYPTYKPAQRQTQQWNYGNSHRSTSYGQERMRSVSSASPVSGYHSTVYTPFGGSTPSGGRSGGSRRVNSSAGDGTYDGQISDDNKYWDGEEWVAIPNGATKDVNGVTYVWNGTAWVAQSHQDDPNTPLGDFPLLLLILLLGGYAALVAARRREEL